MGFEGIDRGRHPATLIFMDAARLPTSESRTPRPPSDKKGLDTPVAHLRTGGVVLATLSTSGQSKGPPMLMFSAFPDFDALGGPELAELWCLVNLLRGMSIRVILGASSTSKKWPL